MRRSRRAAMAVLAAMSVGVLLTGCLPINAGEAAADEFEERVRAEYGDWVEGFRTDSINTLPFIGSGFGSVVLRPDTPPDVFAEVSDYVEGYQVRGFDGAGVEANGVGVCFGDPQIAAKQELRDALHVAGETLVGTWPCPTRGGGTPVPYEGTVRAFGSDIDLLRSLEMTTGLAFEATLTEPSGTVSGPLDQVPGTVATTLETIGEMHEVQEFTLVPAPSGGRGAGGGLLTVAIASTADASAAQAAADAVAAPELAVEVVQGSLDPAEQARYEELGPLLDDLRALPGVEDVDATTQNIAIRTPDAQQVAAIHDAVLAHPDFVDLGLSIVVGPVGGGMGSSYWLPAGGENRHLPDFLALLGADGVTQIAVSEPTAERPAWLNLHTARAITAIVDLKSQLPVGVEAQFSSSSDDHELRFVVADQLRVEDVEDWREEVDIEAFVAAWNAAP